MSQLKSTTTALPLRGGHPSQSPFFDNLGTRYYIFNEAVSRLVTELWKMCTSLAAVALAKVGPRFSLTGSQFSFAARRHQQDQINCGRYTRDIVDRSIGSGYAGLGMA